MMRHMKAFLADEGGTTLPEVIVSVLVNAVAITLISTAIVTFTFMQGRLAETAEASSSASVTETQWRSDVAGAGAVNVLAANTVSFVKAMPNNTCTAHNWSLVDVAGVKELRREDISYSGQAILATGVCAGSATGTVALTLMSKVEAGTLFSFTNAAGRALNPTGGIGMAFVGVAAAPAGIDATLWASTAVGRAALTATVTDQVTLRASQNIHSRSLRTSLVDAPTSWVAP